MSHIIIKTLHTRWRPLAFVECFLFHNRMCFACPLVYINNFAYAHKIIQMDTFGEMQLKLWLHYLVNIRVNVTYPTPEGLQLSERVVYKLQSRCISNLAVTKYEGRKEDLLIANTDQYIGKNRERKITRTHFHSSYVLWLSMFVMWVVQCKWCVQKQISPSLRSTSGVGGPWTRVFVTVLVTTHVQLPTSEGFTLAMYRFPVSCEMNRRVSCFTNVGYSLKIQENTRSADGKERKEGSHVRWYQGRL